MSSAGGSPGTRVSPAERFATLRRELGEAFTAVEIDSSPGNRTGIPSRAHSVLTADMVDEPDHPTRAALDQVIAFYRERLGVGDDATGHGSPAVIDPTEEPQLT